jgi:hypothetical protein
VRHQNLERLEAEYLEEKRKIRADKTLSWEAKERTIRELGLKHRRAVEEMESEAGRSAA